MPAERRRARRCRRSSARANDGHAPPGVGLFAADRPAGAGQAFRHGQPGRFRLLRRRRPTPRPSAPPGPCSIISPRRKRARSPTSTGCCRTARPGTLEIDESSRRSLEITRTIRDGRREGSLLWVLDRTVTAMGSRLLGRVGGQSADRCRRRSRARLDAVGELVGEPVAVRRLARGVCGACTTWSGSWPASPPAGPARAI